ncbi:MAG: pyruvate dehydrogenase (acetyl-transferring) E1 component subunit alpha [Polyangiaceae bacterium]
MSDGKLSKTEAIPAPTPQSSLLDLYRAMLLIRRIEEEAARAYAQGKIGGFLHLYIGQEAIATGAVAALEPNDYVVTTYRDHGLALAKGMEPEALMAELYGKKTGCSGGLGGSMHMFDAKRGMLGGHGIVGSHIPLGAGAAFASKYRGDKRVTLCFFGEGAVSIQGFHEGVSLAALWKLPIVFICENNEYSMGTPLERTMSVPDVSKKASGYGIYGESFEGHDVDHVKARIGEAVKRAREESLPSLLEARTYRYRGHSMSDPGKYRTPQEIEERKQRDPLQIARKRLSEQKVSEEDVKKAEEVVEAKVQASIRFAEESPEPEASILEPTTYDGPFSA